MEGVERGAAKGKESSLHMTLEIIKNARAKGNYQFALDECARLIGEGPHEVMKILRLRASIYTLIGSYEKAHDDYLSIVSFDNCSIGDWYLLANNEVLLEHFNAACSNLQRVLETGVEIGDDAFESAANLLLAYSWLRLGNAAQAQNALDNSLRKDPGEVLPLPNKSGIVTASDLREPINRLSSQPPP